MIHTKQKESSFSHHIAAHPSHGERAQEPAIQLNVPHFLAEGGTKAMRQTLPSGSQHINQQNWGGTNSSQITLASGKVYSSKCDGFDIQKIFQQACSSNNVDIEVSPTNSNIAYSNLILKSLLFFSR